MDGALALRLSLLGCRDPPSGALEVLLLDSFEEAQHLEPGRLIVHVFASVISGAYCNPRLA
ncbi:hypothetical protein [Streptomyces sp. F001]|uniref:hypothetical protein n=1 Tax=Streptomyces sp. F001 TaxID=1510026 RepID=UPI0013EE8D83|nr:hypothetical protein [Streptomyces sp. F001]